MYEQNPDHRKNQCGLLSGHETSCLLGAVHPQPVAQASLIPLFSAFFHRIFPAGLGYPTINGAVGSVREHRLACRESGLGTGG